MTPRARKPDTRKGRSGARWTEADYAAHGYVRLSLRLIPDDARRLDGLRREGETLAGALRRIVAEAWEGTR